LEKEFVFGTRVQAITVPLDPEESFVDFSKPYTVSGWGATSDVSTCTALRIFDSHQAPKTLEENFSDSFSVREHFASVLVVKG